MVGKSLMSNTMEIKKRVISGEGARMYVSAQDIFANTWGHLCPRKNVTYKGHIVVMEAQHGEYGWGTLILSYDFGDINGPYTHEDIMQRVSDNISLKENDDKIYKVEVSFRNYVYYIGKSKIIGSINN
jgi:hypothetical protein